MSALSFVPPAGLAAVMFASAYATAIAQTPPTLETLALTETNNGTTVQAYLEQPISINLPANLSTGFGWYLTNSDGNSVMSNGPSVFTPDSPAVGGPGTLSLPFLAVHTGDTTLNFAYYQPWAPQDALTNFAVTIHVTPLPPILSIALDGENVLITWPITNSGGFFLEGAFSLRPAEWEALNVLPLTNGPNYFVTLGHSGPPLFFRLHKL